MGNVRPLEHYEGGHLKWSFSGKIWRDTSEDRFDIHYGRCKSLFVSDFRSECVKTAKYIGQNTQLPIAVLFSGGVDSEIICRSFSDGAIPFTALIIQFSDGLNLHDVTTAIETSKLNKWNFKIVELDILKWLENEMPKLAERYGIIHPEYAVHMKMMELASQYGFYPIDGRGDISLRHDNGRFFWNETEESLMPTKFMVENGMEGCPRFFKYSPGLIYSWLTDVMMKRWIRYCVPLRMAESHDFKTIIYSQYWEDLVPRIKYTGFEKILKTYRIHRDRLQRKNIVSQKKVMIYDEVLEAIRPRNPSECLDGGQDLR